MNAFMWCDIHLVDVLSSCNFYIFQFSCVNATKSKKIIASSQLFLFLNCINDLERNLWYQCQRKCTIQTLEEQSNYVNILTNIREYVIEHDSPQNTFSRLKNNGFALHFWSKICPHDDLNLILVGMNDWSYLRWLMMMSLILLIVILLVMKVLFLFDF